MARKSEAKRQPNPNPKPKPKTSTRGAPEVAPAPSTAAGTSIAKALHRIKEDVQRFLADEQVERACRDAGHAWRERLLGPVATFHLFLVQVLSFNTAMTHLRFLAGAAVDPGAYCRARKRLPLAALQSLLRGSAAALRNAAHAAAGAAGPPEAEGGGALSCPRWRGLRAWLVDGSSSITPDVPDLRKAFGQPTNQKEGCGFPVIKVLGAFDAFTGMVLEVLTGPLYTHEMSMVCALHPLLKLGDLVVGDRGFCSYAHLALLAVRDVKALFRMHQRQIVSFRPHRKARGQDDKGSRRRRARAKAENGRPTSRFHRRLGKHDQLVWWVRPSQRPKWMDKAQYDLLPGALLVREIRYRIPRRGQRTLCVTIATTLLDPVKYPKEAIADLYNVRWTAETHLAELKTTLRMRKVKGQTPDGVRKELAVYCLVYNLVHTVMAEAARRQKVEPGRISFIDTVRWLLSADPGEEMPALVVNPLRPGRHEPRVVKDRQASYSVMTKPRSELRKELKKQAIAA